MINDLDFFPQTRPGSLYHRDRKVFLDCRKVFLDCRSYLCCNHMLYRHRRRAILCAYLTRNRGLGNASRSLILTRFPSGDICPIKYLFVRFRELTGCGCLTLHKTPSQLQKLVLSFQEIKASFGSLIVLLNSSSDSLSV